MLRPPGRFEHMKLDELARRIDATVAGDESIDDGADRTRDGIRSRRHNAANEHGRGRVLGVSAGGTSGRRRAHILSALAARGPRDLVLDAPASTLDFPTPSDSTVIPRLLLSTLLITPLAVALGQKPIHVDLSREKVNAEPTKFLPMVGSWIVTSEDGKNVILVDGRAWKRGQPAGGLADNARAIYGAKH